MQLLTGTSGFSYKEWKGRFYPEKLPAEEMLRFYSERFRTVEINNTFYRMPEESMLRRWHDEVPSEFAFTLKAPRRITHEKRLRDAGIDVAEFIRRASALQNKIGALLFQLPPFMRINLPVLEEFLRALPSDRRVAFEFRHASWQDQSVLDALGARGAVLCTADTDEGETPLVSTSGSGYLRLRRTHYSDDDLRSWVHRIAIQPWTRVYVYFKHEDAGLGPKFAARFNALWETREEGEREPRGPRPLV